MLFDDLLNRYGRRKKALNCEEMESKYKKTAMIDGYGCSPKNSFPVF